MRYPSVIVILGLAALLVSACGSNSSPLIEPAPDRLTFLFFYTAG